MTWHVHKSMADKKADMGALEKTDPSRLRALVRRRPSPQERLKAAILKWDRTPYMPGQQSPGVGVDCVRFVSAVFDDLLSKESYTPVPTVAPDVSLHDPSLAYEGLAVLNEIYPVKLLSRDPLNNLHPGDCVITGPEEGGPGHGMIVGWEPRVLWHAMAPFVRPVGIPVIHAMGHRLFFVFRLQGWV